jgi:hypothetical protein
MMVAESNVLGRLMPINWAALQIGRKEVYCETRIQALDESDEGPNTQQGR